MALDQSFVGRSWPASNPYLVGREKIREFAAAVGETSTVCTDVTTARAQGYADVIAPPTFPIVLTMAASRVVIADPELGLDYSKVVHGEQRFEYVRPIVAGDELQATVTVETIRSAAGNDILGTRTDVTTVDGEAVCTAYSTLVARGTA